MGINVSDEDLVLEELSSNFGSVLSLAVWSEKVSCLIIVRITWYNTVGENIKYFVNCKEICQYADVFSS